jgi:magnesium-transporting ATPase (P-type)
MSVIIKDKDNTGKDIIRMFTKGAESIIYERIAAGQEDILKQTDHQVCAYAFEGLRCLVVAYADIDIEMYNEWSSRYSKAKTDLNEIDKKKKGNIIIVYYYCHYYHYHHQ